MNRRLLLALSVLGAGALQAQSNCGAQIQLTPDYSYAIGSSRASGAYSFAVAGKTITQGTSSQLALLHFDGALAATNGDAPLQSSGVSLIPGKFGQAAAIAAGGALSYPAANRVSTGDGTIELWFAPAKDGTDPVFGKYDHTLYGYTAANGDQLVLSETASGGGFYAGAIVSKSFTGTGTGSLKVTGLKANAWHHIAYTYSKSNKRQRLYFDGALVGENDSAFSLPAADGAAYTVDSDAYGNASAFLVDELRISSEEKPAAMIQMDALRVAPFGDNEVLLPLAGVPVGQLTFTAGGCAPALYNWTGVPISSLNPPSNLLAAGSTTVNLSFQTQQATACGYSVGTLRDYASMQLLTGGQGSTQHQGVIAGLSSSPEVANQVFIRCASDPDYVQTLLYRAVAVLNPSYPRIGNLWFGSYLMNTRPDLAAKTALFLGSTLTADQLTTLRAANPNILAMPSLGSTYTPPPSIAATPPDYLLKDTHGNPIQIWGGNSPLYLIDLTKPEVATWAANNFYQILAQSGFTNDGFFLDSVSTSISYIKNDVFVHPIQIDANGDGIADDPATLDAAWKAGLLLEIDTLRKLSPNAYLACHCGSEPDILSRFNGTSLVFDATDVREGRTPFASFWDTYNTWMNSAPQPAVVNIEGSPPNQLDYGYGQPIHNMPAGVAQFGKTFYPNMRFPLALALMGGGFFYHSFGDATPAIDWWYDEYDFTLGYPLGPAVALTTQSSANTLINSGFENGMVGWTLSVNSDAFAAASTDNAIAADGNGSARIRISTASSINWHVSFEQQKTSLVAGTSYLLQFWARADTPRTITVHTQGGAPNFPNYGLSQAIGIGTSWGRYQAAFTAPSNASDGRIQFWVGDVAGNVWLDDVQLTLAPSPVYRRDFSGGAVLLNGSFAPRAIDLEPGFQRFKGTQAPKYQYIVDDASAAFTSTGAWKVATYDTGVIWEDGSPTSAAEANGPYYHSWQATVHELDGGVGSAQWDLGIIEDGRYTLQVWLAAASAAPTWTTNAVYEVVSGGSVLATVSLDQTTSASGDGWHPLGSFDLTAGGAPFLRVHNGGTSPLIADAIYVTSDALYNDGSVAQHVTLGPMDGILLQRTKPVADPQSSISSVANAATYTPGVATGGFVSIQGTGLATSAREWNNADFSGMNLPQSLDGVSVTIDGLPAYLEYISPTQIYAIVPDDATIGPVTVQVNTPQGSGHSATVLKQKLAPGFFSYASGGISYAVAIHLDDTLVGPPGPSSRPASPGEVIEIYGTGFGATTPATPTGQLVAQAAAVAVEPTVTLGGASAQVLYAGLVSSGLYQLNVKVPAVVAGDQAIVVNAGGFLSASNVMVNVGQ